MSHPAVDLGIFRKDFRRRLRLSIFMSRLIHFMYLAVKNFPSEATRYGSVEALLKDAVFVKKVLAKESKTDKVKNFDRYLSILFDLRNRGYTGLIEALDSLWRLTIVQKAPMDFLLSLLGMSARIPDMIKLAKACSGKISVRGSPLILTIDKFYMMALEAEYGSSAESLARTTVYVSSLKNTDIRLGLGARFSIKTIDAQKIVDAQNKGFRHLIVKPLRFYPSLLRMYRSSYKKLKAESSVAEEIKCLISETYMDANELGALINMDVSANLLAALPSISLLGGLCFPVAFEGELLKPLSREAVIKISDLSMKAYPAFFSILNIDRYPGHYMFFCFVPITLPKVALVAGSWRTEDLKISKRRRAVSRFDDLFPTIGELLARGG